MTVRELRDRLPWDNEDAEVEVITDKVYDLDLVRTLTKESFYEQRGYALQSVVAVTIDNPGKKVTRVVLYAE